ncbi:MAG: sugar phosphate isomerase/epimerase [Clostridia bacterium]|nr:sugar phosphate isomerase/epimerase [Clostridia bacterium]
MKFGLVTAILDKYDYEQMIDATAAAGFSAVEVACWPAGKAERRYAGVSHIDVARVLEDEAYAAHVLSYAAEHGIEISSLAFYPNTMDADPEKRAAVVAHLMTVIRASAKLNVNMVTTFIGRDQTKSVEENLELVKEVWPPIVALAEELGVKIAIENCPMLFGRDQWPGGQNLMTTPANWKKVFEILPGPNLGINYDPSHFVWQMIDYIKPLYTFRDKIFHVHFKDIKLYRDKLDEVGIMAYPLDFMSPKLPGLGDVDWSKFVSALTDIRYDGYACLEVEDKAFESSEQKVLDSLTISKRYLDQFVI